MSTVESRIARVEEKVQTLFKNDSKQDSMITAVHQMATNMGKMTVSMENMQKEMNSVRVDVDGMKNKPAKQWEDLVKYVITAVCGGIIVFILSKVGLN